LSDTQIPKTHRALLVAVDAEAYSERNTNSQYRLQSSLLDLLDAAATAVGLDRLQWLLQPQGDGELAAIPQGHNEQLVVDSFVHELDKHLTVYNEERLPEARMRLRIAMHFGVSIPAPNGYAGQAPVDVCRILGSDALRDALAADPSANLALALSDSLYEELILGNLTSLRPEDFEACDIVAKKFQGRAWIRVPRRQYSARPSTAQQQSREHGRSHQRAQDTQQATVINHISNSEIGVAGIQNNFGGAR
jgi:hypothetical protein